MAIKTNVQSTPGLQEEIALWHAALAIGGGYDWLEAHQPVLYRRMHKVARGCLDEVNARSESHARVGGRDAR